MTNNQSNVEIKAKKVRTVDSRTVAYTISFTYFLYKVQSTEAALVHQLTVEKDRVDILQQQLEHTMAEKLALLYERKKGLRPPS